MNFDLLIFYDTQKKSPLHNEPEFNNFARLYNVQKSEHVVIFSWKRS